MSAPRLTIWRPRWRLLAARAIDPCRLAPGPRIDPTASLTRTVVWDGAVVGAGCRLDECIVADGVTLPPGTTLQRRICLRASTGEREGEGTLGNAVIYSLDGRPAADP